MNRGKRDTTIAGGETSSHLLLCTAYYRARRISPGMTVLPPRGFAKTTRARRRPPANGAAGNCTDTLPSGSRASTCNSVLHGVGRDVVHGQGAHRNGTMAPSSSPHRLGCHRTTACSQRTHQTISARFRATARSVAPHQADSGGGSQNQALWTSAISIAGRGRRTVTTRSARSFCPTMAASQQLWISKPIDSRWKKRR